MYLVTNGVSSSVVPFPVDNLLINAYAAYILLPQPRLFLILFQSESVGVFVQLHHYLHSNTRRIDNLSSHNRVEDGVLSWLAIVCAVSVDVVSVEQLLTLTRRELWTRPNEVATLMLRDGCRVVD